MPTTQESSDTKDRQKLIYCNTLTRNKQATNVTAAKLQQNNTELLIAHIPGACCLSKRRAAAGLKTCSLQQVCRERHK